MAQQIGALFASSFSSQDSGTHLSYHENQLRHPLHQQHYNTPQTAVPFTTNEINQSRTSDNSHHKTLRHMCDVSSNTFNGLKLPANYLKRLQDAGVLQLDRPLLSSGANSTVDDEEDDQLSSLDAVWKRYQTAENTIRQLEQAIFTEEDEYLRESLPIGNLLQGMQFTPDRLEKAKEIVKERQELSIREGYGPEVLVICPTNDRIIDDNDRLFLQSCGPHAMRTCAPLLRERHAEIEHAKQLQEDIEREEDKKRGRTRRSPVHFGNKSGRKSPTPILHVLVPEDDVNTKAVPSTAGNKRRGRTPITSAASDADDKKKKSSSKKHNSSKAAVDASSSVSSAAEDDVPTRVHGKTGGDDSGRALKSSVSKKLSPPAASSSGKKSERHAVSAQSPTAAKKRGQKTGGRNKSNSAERSSGAKKDAKKAAGGSKTASSSRRGRNDSDEYDDDSESDDDDENGSSSSSGDASSQSSASSSKSDKRRTTTAKSTAAAAASSDNTAPKARRGRPRKNEVRPKKATPVKATKSSARSAPAAKTKKARTGGAGSRGRGRPPKKQAGGTSRLSESGSSEHNETLSDDDDGGSSGSSTGSLSSSSD